MVLVIVGAGASFECLPQDVHDRLRASPEFRNYRPPLARQLFDLRESFGTVLEDHQECAPIVGKLRRILGANRDASIEQELEKVQAEAGDYLPDRVALIELRRYLQEILGKCGDWILQSSHGDTLYAELVRRIGRWRHEAREPVTIVNFNYDTILDRALETNAGLDLRWPEAYMGDEWRYLKLHGSVDWYRKIPAPSESTARDRRAATRFLALPQAGDNGSEHFGSDQLLIAPPGLNVLEGTWDTILLPAVAVPYETKFAFECPREHLDELDRGLRETLSILVIGWRGSERHFLDRLGAYLPGKAPAILIVSDKDEGARQTMDNLASAKLAEDRARLTAGGFRGFLQSDLLEQFLAEPFEAVARRD